MNLTLADITLADLSIAIGIIWLVGAVLFMCALGLRAKLSAGDGATPKDASACGPEVAPADSDLVCGGVDIEPGTGSLMRRHAASSKTATSQEALVASRLPAGVTPGPHTNSLSTRPAPFTQPASPAANASPGCAFPEDTAARVENFASGGGESRPATTELGRLRKGGIEPRGGAGMGQLTHSRLAPGPLAIPSRWGSAEKGELLKRGLQIRRMAP